MSIRPSPLALMAAMMIAVACVGPTEGRNPRCWYPGDTIAMVGPIPDERHVMRCVWLVIDHISCLLPQELGIAGKLTAADCVIPAQPGRHP